MTKKTERDKDALTIDRPEAFLRHERAVQKAGVVALTLFVAAGLAGVFGDGPLANATVTSGAITIRFERFVRQTYRTNVEISVTGASSPSVLVTIPRALLDNVDVLEVRPADTLKRVEEASAIFEVPADGGSATLILYYEPKSAGILQADIGVNGGPAAHVRQVVFF